MKRVYVFGIGEGKKYLDRCLLKDVDICGYIDNYKAGKMASLDGKPVVGQRSLEKNYDYIIITLMQYDEARKSLYEEGVEEKKVISFFNFYDAANESYWKVIDSFKWRIELMWKHYLYIGIPSIDNMGHEMYADTEYMKNGRPYILDAKNTANILRKERKCLARFGDGEFELICGRPRPIFQEVDDVLSKRLKEVLDSQEENLLVAISDNYGSLAKYTDDAAKDIRIYMTKDVRESHMKLLDLDRKYYDAYISRPYIIYRDKENAKERFDWVIDIWKGEDVLIIEGEHTRFGVGNDLLENARSIQRIIVPDRNAFEKYEEIKNAAYEYGKDKLLLSVLGPTATVLAYDLAKEGYWIIDIGQLDTEYGWFLEKVEKRCGLKYKRVSEVGMHGQLEIDIFDENMQSYFNEIVEKIL